MKDEEFVSCANNTKVWSGKRCMHNRSTLHRMIYPGISPIVRREHGPRSSIRITKTRRSKTDPEE